MVKNNIELDVKVKCIENSTTQAQIAEDIQTTKSYVNRIIKKQDGSESLQNTRFYGIFILLRPVAASHAFSSCRIFVALFAEL